MKMTRRKFVVAGALGAAGLLGGNALGKPAVQEKDDDEVLRRKT